MKITVEAASLDAKNCDLLVVPMFEDALALTPALKTLDGKLDGVLSLLVKTKVFTGGDKNDAYVYHPKKVRAKRIVLFGLGKHKDFCRRGLRQKAFNISCAAGREKAKNIAVYLGAVRLKGMKAEDVCRTVAEGLHYAGYDYQGVRLKKKEKAALAGVTLLVDSAGDARYGQTAVNEAAIVMEGVAITRDLQNMPANLCTPRDMAAAARKLSQHGVKVTINDEKAMEKLKMGAFLGVAQGSDQPPRFVQMEYRPRGGKRVPTLVLVGKGLTFDAGGISIKPAQGMEQMKMDMSGAAAVIGAMSAIARLKLNAHVYGLIGCTENLINGKATKPGDVHVTCSGKSIEVQNTDAEGRLVLADLLGYAKRLEPDAVVDLATLTGACVIALGDDVAGLMTNSEKLGNRLKKSAERVDEPVWELPLVKDYDKQLDSDVADMKNITGKRGAGTITAGLFLQRFVDYDWAHLDIAGPAMQDGSKGYINSKGSGFPVRLLVDYVAGWKK